MKHALRSLALLVLAIATIDIVYALPRFASRTGVKCQSCHLNPSGGGMRQTFGVTYGRDELPVPTWSEELGLEDFSTKLTDFVSIGADFRTLYFVQQNPSSTNNAFWQMQGDIYMNLRLAKKVNIYLDKGLYRGFEIFGMLGILPANGYIKLGRFLPNYGLKMDDHRLFVRDILGLSPEGRGTQPSGALIGGPEHTGAEVAVSPGSITIMGGIYNAADAYGSATNNQKAFLGRAEGIFKLNEQMNLGLGGNVYTQRQSNASRMTMLGGFGSLSYRNLTVLGEVDIVKVTNSSDALVTFAELDYVATTGLELKFIIEFYDPNVDLKSGSTTRYSFGVEFFPISGVEVRPLYRISKEDPTDTQNDEFHLVFHFYL